MLVGKSVLFSTNPAKDGTQFAVSELEKALDQSAIVGLTSCLGHDSTKPIAWTVPNSLYFEPKVCRLAGETLIPEDVQEQQRIMDLHQRTLLNRAAKDFAPHQQTFEDRLKGKLSDNYKILSSTLVSIIDQGIVERVYPALMTKADKDGLLYIKDILMEFNYLGQGVFQHRKSSFAICAHHYFRRSLSRQNNLNYFFLDKLMTYKDRPELTLRLRIDPDLIGIAETFVPAMEFEFWRGPGFNNDVSNVKLGVTTHGMDEYNKLFNGIERTEFWWKIESGEQAFECEEVKSKPSLGISRDDYGCRYAHSIYDTSAKLYNHFDGAIRMYDADQILERWDKDIKSAGKQSVYTKLFRVDKKLDLADWKTLLHHYFQGNHLIAEYLEPGQPADFEPYFEPETIPITEESVIPVTLTSDQGIRLAISYLPIKEDETAITATHQLVGCDTFDEQALENVVELDILEIKKSLLREGFELAISPNCEFLDCYDGGHWNIPEILVNNDGQLETSMRSLLKAVKHVLIAKNILDQTVSFTFSWNDEALERKVVCSVLGTSEIITKWLDLNQSIPVTHDLFKDWINTQFNWLSNYDSEFDVPNLSDVLYNDGTLYIKREPVFNYALPESIKIEGAGVAFTLKPEYEDLANAIHAKRLVYSPTYHVTRIVCPVCNEDYFTCPHSSSLDKFQVSVAEFQLIGYCWAKP